MTKTLTTTTAIPQRINAEHYEIASESPGRLGKVYDLVFDTVVKRWICNCNDTTKNHNPDCKHRRRLVTWIAEQEAGSQVQREATEIAEQAEPAMQEPVITIEITNSQIYGMMSALMEAEITIKAQDARIGYLEYDVQAMQQIHQVAMAQQDHHIDMLEQMLAQAISQIATTQAQLTALENRKAERPTPTPKAPKALSEAERERLEWEEFEADQEAGRAAAAERRRNAPLANYKDFSLNR